MATATPVIESSLTTPKVRSISVEQPWQWLAAGWKDLWRAPTVSIPYGLMFVVMGYALVYTIETRFQYALALTTGFLLVGPFLSMGLYDVSRRLEAGRTPTLPLALTAWRNNLLPIALFGVLIGLLMIVWVRLSSLLFAVFMGGTNFSVDSSLTELFFRGSGFKFLLVFALIGAVVAAVVFAISVVSIPMMLDRKIDFITAVLTSLTAVRRRADQPHRRASQSRSHGAVGDPHRDLYRNRPDHLLSGPRHCLALGRPCLLARLSKFGR